MGLSETLEREILALPTPFYLFRLLSGSDHLHFGYFRSERDDVGQAQESMMELNLFFRPAHLTRVLDVGSGLGATSRRLARLGCKVTAICPDPALIHYSKAAEAAEGAASPVEWVTSGFEEWKPNDTFDFVLFQESFQYFDHVEATLRRAHEILRPGGGAAPDRRPIPQ